MEHLRLPASATDSELYVIGALILTEGRAWDQIDWCKPEWFYRHDHRTIFECIKGLCEGGKPLDIMLLADALGDNLTDAGGSEYLARIVVDTPAVSNLKHHARQVEKAAILRGIQIAAMDVSERAFSTTENPQQLAEEAADRFGELMEGREHGDLVPMHKAVADAIDWMDSPEQGISTGFLNLDATWGGLKPADLIILAGRPSMGKSALAMNIAEQVAREHGVLVLSLEMTARAIAKRSLTYHADRVGRNEAYALLSGLKLWIDEKPAVGIGYLRARAKRVKRQHGLGLIVVDYMQLMTSAGENRTQEISAISRGLKQVAKELNVPIIAVSQLNRAVETRPDRRPLMSDLRESGQIEQDADLIAFVYRDEYYNQDSPFKGIAEVITRKNREGVVGTSYMTFSPEQTRFRDFAGQLPQVEAPKFQRAGSVRSVDFKARAGGDE